MAKNGCIHCEYTMSHPDGARWYHKYIMANDDLVSQGVKASYYKVWVNSFTSNKRMDDFCPIHNYTEIYGIPQFRLFLTVIFL